VACDALELEALHLLCAHAADVQRQRPLVLAVLRTAAARLAYPGLPAYIAYHMTSLVFAWCAHPSLLLLSAQAECMLVLRALITGPHPSMS
jgi:hypothetical protein